MRLLPRSNRFGGHRFPLQGGEVLIGPANGEKSFEMPRCARTFCDGFQCKGVKFDAAQAHLKVPDLQPETDANGLCTKSRIGLKKGCRAASKVWEFVAHDRRPRPRVLRGNVLVRPDLRIVRP